MTEEERLEKQAQLQAHDELRDLFSQRGWPHLVATLEQKIQDHIEFVFRNTPRPIEEVENRKGRVQALREVLDLPGDVETERRTLLEELNDAAPSEG